MQLNLFSLYVLFTMSWFLHLPERVPVLGAMRLDLLLVIVILIGLFLTEQPVATDDDSKSTRALKLLLIYIIITIPFVQWPGSVIKSGIPNFIKASMFYFFTVRILNSEKKLLAFFYIFVACEAFRVLEPVYLHLTEGYWGSSTYMDGDMMARLAGAPSDTINGNGLAFVICTTVSFLYFLSRSFSRPIKFIILLSYPVFGYALILTASRTGILALGVIMAAIFFKSRRKLMLALTFSLAVLIVVPILTPLQRDRYLSIGRDDVAGASTAKLRVTGIIDDFKAGLEKPIIGHGVGTSLELNANRLGQAMPAHNLYVEIFQELGGIGLLIFGYFLYSIVHNLSRVLRKAKKLPAGPSTASLIDITDALQTWMYMNLLFSVASYGLNSNEWYLLGGGGVVLNRLITARTSPTSLVECLSENFAQGDIRSCPDPT